MDQLAVRPSLLNASFLKDAPPEAIAAAEEAVEWISIPGGWPVFEAGDPADAIYFVLSGSLGAFRRLPSGKTELLGYIRPGEPVGEMAMVAGDAHTNAVYTLRDSELFRIERTAFNKLIRSYPALMNNLARIMLVRARQTKRPSRRGNARLYGLVATSPTIDLHGRAIALKESIKRLGRSCAIVREGDYDLGSNFCDELETKFDVVLLLTKVEDSAWFRFCMRQSDRLVVFGRTDARPSTPLIPQERNAARQMQLVDIVLLRHGEDRAAATPGEWMEAANAARLFYWRENDPDDCMRLARTLTSLSVGLVLSGGGARAYAHIGVIRALREARVPLDFVGGASMGAVLAACVAMGWNDDEIESRIRKAFVESNPLSDYVLPVVSLVEGKRVDERLEENFGDMRIEDMRTPFFCVSTDLVTATTFIHRSGLLRHHLRASISLPGILPPIVDGDKILVDGAVLNNFPVDVMQDFHRGFTIGCDVARQTALEARDFLDPPKFLGWVAEHGMRAAPPIAGLLMRAATMTINPSAMREETDLLILPDLRAVDLRDWRRFDDAVIAGYEATVARLRELPPLLSGRLPRDSQQER
ncbi:MAG: patatin-like phospholipase family protein [Caulobacterales bacterium]